VTRPRVLELAKGLDVGGMEMLLLERLKVADRENFDYTVGYLDPHRTDLLSSIESLGVPVRCLGASSVMDWRWMVPLRKWLRSGGVDVVHVHSPLMAPGVRAVVRSLGRARPILITTEHNVKYHLLTEIADIATIRADDLVIAVSVAVSGSRACRAARHVETVHYGIDICRVTGLAENRVQHSADLGLAEGLRIVSVANFRAEKDHSTLLKAARLVHARVPSAHFYLAGHGPLEPLVASEVKRHEMTNYFHLLGRVPNAARLSASADIFVLSSLWEGRPVALMEALAAGVPAVVTEVGGMPDMVHDNRNGRLVPPSDAEALAAALLSLLEDPVLRLRLSAGASKSGANFDMARASNTIEGHYSRLMADRRRLGVGR
jgi:glycosyltransferase involved in cell wall biosynthesis